MTKIKNTKKGMAKKTLSVSLAVAMLATSNVPVWAAEFSDGADAAAFTSEVEAPVVEAEAPVVDEAEADVPVAQVAEGYTVNTNMELKDGDWATPLVFGKKDGVTEDAKFEILDGNTVPVSATKVEIYSGLDLIKTQTVSDGNIANALTAARGVGLAAYKNNKQVTIKVYVEGENTPVYEETATVKAVNIEGWTVLASQDTATYNGEIKSPTVSVTKAGYDAPASVVVKFEDEKEAKNVGEYTYYVEGVEADGYTGEAKAVDPTFTITAATASTTNISVVISGTHTYNGSTVVPTFVVTDKLTNTVIPSELVTVTPRENNVKEYDKDNVTITLAASAQDADGNTLTGNITGSVPTECITGSYKVEALDLSKLTQKYNVSVATKKVGEGVTFNDITLTDKATNKEVDKETVFGTISNSGDSSNSLVTIVTSNNTTKGTGKVIIRSTVASSTNVINEFSTSFNVVNATVTAEDVAFAKGTKVNGKTYGTKMPLAADTGTSAASDITAVLDDITYTGSAIEPLKEAFSNLVLVNSVTTDEEKLILGTDYDIVYTDNTDSSVVNKKTPTVKLIFKGKYSGTIPYTFTIKPAVPTVEAADLEYVPGQNSYNISAKVTTGSGADEKDVPSEYYTVTTTQKATSAIGNSAVGVVVFNNKNYVGSLVPGQIREIEDLSDLTANAPYGVTKDGRYCVRIETALAQRKITKCTATIEGNYVYTGEAISPKLVVKDGNTVLTEGKDYKIVSKTGTNAGPAHVTIKGMGNYTDQLTVDYTIAKANLANAVVLNESGKENYDRAYNGYAQSPDFKTVKIGNKPLYEYDPVSKTGDYTLTYDESAIEVGTYNFTLTAVAGSKNVEGEFKGTFKVIPCKLTAGFAPKFSAIYKDRVKTALTVDKTGAYYTGKEITIDSFKTKYVVVTEADKVLTEGKEYELKYTANVEAGIATVEAYGIGNYTMKDSNNKVIPIATMQYNIEPTAVITSSMVKKISDVEYAGGLPVEPQVVILNAKGERLVQGVDYTVETRVVDVTTDTTNANAGTQLPGEVTIKGKGAYLTATVISGITTTNYDNTALSLSGNNLNWKVTKKDLKNTVISVDADKKVTVMNGTVVVPASEYTVEFSADGKKVTVTAKADSKNYTGSKEQDVDVAAVGQAWVKDVNVVGNKATVILSDEVDNASGYDYVIATEDDLKSGRVDIVKNQIKTTADFQYVQKGTYYAYCHAWKRVDGKKVFGEWSNVFQFTVGATTPAQPVITSVKRSGSTVTVTYTKAANADGYDVVLGTKTAVVSGEKRPVNYGTLVKKNVKGDTVTVTFKDVPAGTYYAGLHAWNRTSLDNKKVFSPWSNIKTVTVK